MKISGITLLIITSIILVLLTIFAGLDFSFGPLFYLMIIGQVMLLYTVYRILKDDYVTNKTFDDMYEDHSPHMDD